MQLSILLQRRTMQLLAQRGFAAEVLEFALFPLRGHFAESRAHIATVEQQSDAYHLDVDGDDIMVAYLLKISWADPEDSIPTPPGK